MNDANADIALLRDLIDRRPDLNACALRPGQAVHVHALERILADLQPGGPEYTERMCYHHDRDTLLADVAALLTFEEMCGYDEGEEIPVKPGEVDELILRARGLLGYTLAQTLPPSPVADDDHTHWTAAEWAAWRKACEEAGT